MYGRGVASIAEQIGSSVKEAQDIIDSFYKSFPNVKKWMDKTVEDARKTGYVEDMWGRRRRLPDITLPKYSIENLNATSEEENNFNPFLECRNRLNSTLQKKINDYMSKVEKAQYKKEIDKIKDSALKDGLHIHDNSGYISQAERQCVNARIQGGSATMTKIAMIKLFNDKELNDLGFKLLIGVHDELIGECPIENQDKVADRLTYVMKTCIDDISKVPFKCDADVCTHWYFNDYCDVLRKDFTKDLKESNKSKDELFEEYVIEHTEMLREELENILLKD